MTFFQSLHYACIFSFGDLKYFRAFIKVDFFRLACLPLWSILFGLMSNEDAGSEG